VSGLGVAAVIALGALLGGLCLVCLLLVRQVGLLTVRLDRMGDANRPVHDGLDVGASAPTAITDAIMPAASGPTYILVFAAICGPCRELAVGLPKVAPPSDPRTMALISGGTKELGEGLAALLPDWVAVIEDPAATDLVNALQVETTPFIFEITRGEVSAKAALRGAEHLMAFLQEGESDALQMEVVASGA
jgi:hypothetical protein